MSRVTGANQEVLDFGDASNLADSDKDLLQRAKVAREKKSGIFSDKKRGKFSKSGSRTGVRGGFSGRRGFSGDSKGTNADGRYSSRDGADSASSSGRGTVNSDRFYRGDRRSASGFTENSGSEGKGGGDLTYSRTGGRHFSSERSGYQGHYGRKEGRSYHDGVSRSRRFNGDETRGGFSSSDKPGGRRFDGERSPSRRDGGERRDRGDESEGFRISKRLADLGCCSRRDAETLVTEGKVKINNIVLKDLSYKVMEDDTIIVNGKPIANKTPRLKIYLFHKPKGCVTTTRDPQGRRTVFSMIPERFGRLITVGRLDYDTEGLLILTNSGDFAREMELPASGFRRDYEVLVSGEVTQEKLDLLEEGVEIDGTFYKSAIVNRYKEGPNDTNWLRVAIFEGKNREVRNLMGHVGLEVVRLIRVGYGKFKLSGIPVGCVVEYRGS